MEQKSQKLVRLITLLFESKFKKYTEITLDAWVELLQVYDEKKLDNVIYEIIYTNDGFISIGMIHEKMKEKKKSLKQIQYEQKIYEYMKDKCVDMDTAIKKLKEK